MKTKIIEFEFDILPLAVISVLNATGWMHMSWWAALTLSTTLGVFSQKLRIKTVV